MSKDQISAAGNMTTTAKPHVMELLTNTINEHTLHNLLPVTPDPNGPWEVECNCDAPKVTTDGYLSGERAHAEHVAQMVLAAMLQNGSTQWAVDGPKAHHFTDAIAEDEARMLATQSGRELMIRVTGDWQLAGGTQ